MPDKDDPPHYPVWEGGQERKQQMVKFLKWEKGVKQTVRDAKKTLDEVPGRQPNPRGGK